ncbi:MAG TPA: DUF1707 domain-containing protein [Nocardioidaceae bacterium]|nr:DUF1707 domain-containing protein [Nocardioidaceae bacterium]
MSSATPWASFSHDPRRPETAGLRASDQDRSVVSQLLADAYADGRLDREEYDERADAASRAKTLGDLPPVVADLVPDLADRPGSELALATPDELRTRAVEEYHRSRRNALSGMLVPSLICVVIWVLTGFGGKGFDPSFFWPGFVILGTGVNLLRTVVNKQNMIEDERRKLEKKQRKALESPEASKAGSDQDS